MQSALPTPEWSMTHGPGSCQMTWSAARTTRPAPPTAWMWRESSRTVRGGDSLDGKVQSVANVVTSGWPVQDLFSKLSVLICFSQLTKQKFPNFRIKTVLVVTFIWASSSSGLCRQNIESRILSRSDYDMQSCRLLPILGKVVKFWSNLYL